jgi:hypothetical protein
MDGDFYFYMVEVVAGGSDVMSIGLLFLQRAFFE